MRPNGRCSRQSLSRCLVIGTVAIASAGGASEIAAGSQSDAVADLTARILACTVHPCLGDSVKSVREAVRDAIASDEVSYIPAREYGCRARDSGAEHVSIDSYFAPGLAARDLSVRVLL